MVRRTKTEASRTREKILLAAEKVFSRDGVSDSTLEDIAFVAGVTRGAIYWHFKNKARLLEELMSSCSLPLLMTHDSHQVITLDAFRNWIRDILIQTACTPQYWRLSKILLNEWIGERQCVLKAKSTGFQNPLLHEARQRLTACLNQLKQTAAITSYLDVSMAAWSLHIFLCGIISDWLASGQEYALEKQADRWADVMMFLLSGCSASPQHLNS